MCRGEAGDAQRPPHELGNVGVVAGKPKERDRLNRPEGNEGHQCQSDPFATQRFQISENRVADECRDQSARYYSGNA